MKVKIVSAAPVNLEKSINDWMEATPDVDIKHVTQSESQGIVTVTIFYA